MIEIAAATLAVAPSQALSFAMQSLGGRAAGHLESIWFGWPNLEIATQRLAAHISHGFPSPGAPATAGLLANTLAGAVDAYTAARRTARDELDLPRAYLRGLLCAADGLVAYDVFGVTGAASARWRLGDQPLTEFAHDWEKICFMPTDDPERLHHAAVSLLMGCTMSLEDIALLGDTPYSLPRPAPAEPPTDSNVVRFPRPRL